MHEAIKEWRESGSIEYVRWATANDSEVCSVCQSRAEKEFLLSEIESLLPAHDGCRCVVMPIVSTELARKQRRRRLGLED